MMFTLKMISVNRDQFIHELKCRDWIPCFLNWLNQPVSEENTSVHIDTAYVMSTITIPPALDVIAILLKLGIFKIIPRLLSSDFDEVK